MTQPRTLPPIAERRRLSNHAAVAQLSQLLQLQYTLDPDGCGFYGTVPVRFYILDGVIDRWEVERPTQKFRVVA